MVTGRPGSFSVGLQNSFEAFRAGVSESSINRCPRNLRRRILMTSLHRRAWHFSYKSTFLLYQVFWATYLKKNRTVYDMAFYAFSCLNHRLPGCWFIVLPWARTGFEIPVVIWPLLGSHSYEIKEIFEGPSRERPWTPETLVQAQARLPQPSNES